MPAVAMADGMGTSSQITDGKSGILIAPRTPSEEDADVAFAEAVLRLAKDPILRKELGQGAERAARDRRSPGGVEERLAQAFCRAERPSMAHKPRARPLRAETL